MHLTPRATQHIEEYIQQSRQVFIHVLLLFTYMKTYSSNTTTGRQNRGPRLRDAVDKERQAGALTFHKLQNIECTIAVHKHRTGLTGLNILLSTREYIQPSPPWLGLLV